jgi:hypothetical protein
MDNIIKKDIKIIIQTELDGKHLAMGKSVLYPKEIRSVGTMTRKWVYGTRGKRSNKLKVHYYLLWGTTADIADMGITWLCTESGKQMSQSSAHNIFFRAVKASKYISISRKRTETNLDTEKQNTI